MWYTYLHLTVYFTIKVNQMHVDIHYTGILWCKFIGIQTWIILGIATNIYIFIRIYSTAQI